jgi:hypothetical protein
MVFLLLAWSNESATGVSYYILEFGILEYLLEERKSILIGWFRGSRFS